MSVKLMYEIITKEKFVYRMDPETYEGKDIERARARYLELIHDPCIVNLRHEITSPIRHVVYVKYKPDGDVYTFETDLKIKKGEALIVDDIYNPGKEVYIIAVSEDHDESEADLAKKFDLKKLRSIKRKAA